MLNTRIKCRGIKKSEGRLFVRDKLIILFITKLNLFIDLFWKNKVIGIRKGHDNMNRSMYVQESILVCLDYLYVTKIGLRLLSTVFMWAS